ncbi:hypothetical protein F4803DRAFT_536488 [Xylaria telfairii]|nr:hypothetical protein F4803DRAFT_536488 [Xylaria telfairii]
MEVLGAVAAASQLCGMLIQALDETARLRDLLRHAPTQYTRWNNELIILEEAISLIKANESLHTCTVMRLIEIITGKIKELTSFVCKNQPPLSDASFIKKLLWVPRARSIENRILQSFESLEYNKTTLILLINLSNGSISVENFRTAIMDVQARSSNQAVCRHGQQTLQNVDLTGLIQKILASLQPASKTSPDEDGEKKQPAESTQPTQVQHSVFEGITLKGNDSLFGSTIPTGITFREVNITGSRRVDGMHNADAAISWRQNVQHR